MLVSIVGHASFQTAGISGPSIIERSYCRRPRFASGLVIAGAVSAAAVASVNTRSPTSNQRVDTPRPCAREHEIKEDEAVQHRGDSPVPRRPERHRKTELEICNRHFTGENERDRTCEQPERECQTKISLQPASDVKFPHRRHRERWYVSREWWESKHLGRPASEEREAGHDSQNAQHSACR